MKSQSDIALENQKGIEKANRRLNSESDQAENDRATQFDGSSEQKNAGGILKPKDDTPARLEKREQRDK